MGFPKRCTWVAGLLLPGVLLASPAVRKGRRLRVLNGREADAMSRKHEEGEADAMSRMHEEWMAKYGRVYKDEAEKKLRLEAFRRSVERVESANQRAGRRVFGLSGLADYTDEERKSLRSIVDPSVDPYAGCDSDAHEKWNE